MHTSVLICIMHRHLSLLSFRIWGNGVSFGPDINEVGTIKEKPDLQWNKIMSTVP